MSRLLSMAEGKIVRAQGYTILEILIALAIITLMSVGAIVYLRGGIVVVTGDGATRDLATSIRSARGHAAAGDLGAGWGVRTVHGALGGNDSFELFATTSGSATPNAVDPSILPTAEVHPLLPGTNWGESTDRSVIFLPAQSTITPVTFLLKYGNANAQVIVASSGSVIVQ